jgi:hypothetical protein
MIMKLSKMKAFTGIIAIGTLSWTAQSVLAQGCCEEMMPCAMENTVQTMDSPNRESLAVPQSDAAGAALSAPTKAVLDSYIKVQTALAQDSFAMCQETAGALAKALQNDSEHTFPATVAQQADAVAKAKDLAAARESFKALSDSLIKHLKDHKANGAVYREAYCPMVKASWLQTGKTITNPYMGKAMPDCGEFKD